MGMATYIQGFKKQFSQRPVHLKRDTGCMGVKTKMIFKKGVGTGHLAQW